MCVWTRDGEKGSWGWEEKGKSKRGEVLSFSVFCLEVRLRVKNHVAFVEPGEKQTQNSTHRQNTPTRGMARVLESDGDAIAPELSYFFLLHSMQPSYNRQNAN